MAAAADPAAQAVIGVYDYAAATEKSILKALAGLSSAFQPRNKEGYDLYSRHDWKRALFYKSHRIIGVATKLEKDALTVVRYAVSTGKLCLFCSGNA